VSVGVACEAFDPRTAHLEDAEQGEALFRAADQALYQAKQLGRNHVCVV
jgi:PleD family two-component response regulator